MKLEELHVYQLSMDLGEKVWNLVTRWDYFAKDTVGKQLVRAADSVAANIGEGIGRFFYKENRQFCYYARGSFYEAKTWVRKAHMRRLIKDDEYEEIVSGIESIGVKLNNYIKSIGKRKDEE